MDVDGGSQQPSNGNNKKQQRFTELLQPISSRLPLSFFFWGGGGMWLSHLCKGTSRPTGISTLPTTWKSTCLKWPKKITYFFDNQRHSLNFAEAALLIQNSASVYSRKVEYLYNLVHQTLELISSKKYHYCRCLYKLTPP